MTCIAKPGTAMYLWCSKLRFEPISGEGVDQNSRIYLVVSMGCLARFRVASLNLPGERFLFAGLRTVAITQSVDLFSSIATFAEPEASLFFFLCYRPRTFSPYYENSSIMTMMRMIRKESFLGRERESNRCSNATLPAVFSSPLASSVRAVHMHGIIQQHPSACFLRLC